MNYDNLTQVHIPIGIVLPFASTNIPLDFVQCDGVELLKTDYTILHSVIGVIYGETNGSNATGTTHFRVPDYIDMFLRGHSNGTSTDPDSGSRTDRGDGVIGDNVGTRQSDQMRSHNHQFGYWWRYSDLSQSAGNPRPVPHYTYDWQNFNRVNEISEIQSGSRTDTRPDNIRVVYAIKVI